MSTTNKPLTREEAQQVRQAIQRLSELSKHQSAVITKDSANNATEISGLKIFLARIFADHAEEFIVCWFAVRDEYEPLIGMFSMVKLRADTFLQARLAEANAQEKDGVA